MGRLVQSVGSSSSYLRPTSKRKSYRIIRCIVPFVLAIVALLPFLLSLFLPLHRDLFDQHLQWSSSSLSSVLVDDEDKTGRLSPQRPKVTTKEEQQQNDNGNGKSSSSSSQQQQPFTSFAACLMLKDDNKILPEWLAYHYQVMPLRYLIISADKGNVTSPERILNQFRHFTDIQIDVWDGEDDLLPDILKGESHNFRMIERQISFYSKCLQHLHDKTNYTWTMMIDTDEFMVYNKLASDETWDPDICGRNKSWTPLEKQECVTKIRNDNKDGTSPRSQLPNVGEMTVAQYIHREEMTNSKNNIWKQYPCMIYPRLFFGPHESSKDKINNQVPTGFNATAFKTMLYRKHDSKFYLTKAGKSIVDASRLDSRQIDGPHNPMKGKCNTNYAFPSYDDSLLRIHHYTASLDEFLSRPTDLRRTKEEYISLNNFTPSGSNDDIRGWLNAFVNNVGKDKALELTQRSRAKSIIDDNTIIQQIQNSLLRQDVCLNYVSSKQMFQITKTNHSLKNKIRTVIPLLQKAITASSLSSGARRRRKLDGSRGDIVEVGSIVDSNNNDSISLPILFYLACSGQLYGRTIHMFLDDDLGGKSSSQQVEQHDQRQLADDFEDDIDKKKRQHWEVYYDLSMRTANISLTTTSATGSNNNATIAWRDALKHVSKHVGILNITMPSALRDNADNNVVMLLCNGVGDDDEYNYGASYDLTMQCLNNAEPKVITNGWIYQDKYYGGSYESVQDYHHHHHYMRTRKEGSDPKIQIYILPKCSLRQRQRQQKDDTSSSFVQNSTHPTNSGKCLNYTVEAGFWQKLG